MQGFAIPTIQQNGLSLPAAAKASHIQNMLARFAGRYAFAPAIRLNRPDSLGSDLIQEPGWKLPDADTLNTDGLEIHVDYRQNLVWKHDSTELLFPVYLVNATTHTKLVFGKDSWMPAVQEALDRQGHWRAIELRSPAADMCGNGEWALRLHPRQMGVLLLPKYQGTFKTKLRVRITNGTASYVSLPYEARIDESQFTATRRQVAMLQKYPEVMHRNFCGATPAALDSLRQNQ